MAIHSLICYSSVMRRGALPLLSCLALPGYLAAAPHRFFQITVREAGTGSPISGATLTTTNQIVYESDRNGLVAFYEPGLMGLNVFFTASKQGYEQPADGFGIRGQALAVSEGKSGTIELRRSGGPVGPDSTSNEDTDLLRGPVPGPAQRFRLDVVDDATGRGVPLVAVSAGQHLHYSDSAGVIALYDPSIFGKVVTFTARSHGYDSIEQALVPQPGGHGTILLHRINLAERLYRVTGGGIYGESALLDLPATIRSPVLNGQVMGQDSVLTAVYQGRIFWIWGDTNQPGYLLGNYHATGAWSEQPSAGGLAPDVGVDLNYYTEAGGFVRQMAPDPAIPGPGVTWLGGLVSVKDEVGAERLFATFGKYGENLTELDSGMARFDDQGGIFEKVYSFPPAQAPRPTGQAFVVAHGGQSYVYYVGGVRAPASAAALSNPGSFEAFTARLPGSDEIDRAADGTARYAFRAGARVLGKDDVDAGKIRRDEALWGNVTDIETGDPIEVHDNSDIGWNALRGRYVGILLQKWGRTSGLGELWYAEADTPMGPWLYARHIVTHDDYSFYNPRHHPFFDRDGGRWIYFEGTYTAAFSSAKVATPRYDYNQMLYRLDLADPRLILPVPIYALVGAGGVPQGFASRAALPIGTGALRAAFFAPDRQMPGTVPVAQAGCGQRLQVGGEPAIFYALPTESGAPETVPLYEYRAGDGSYAYSTEGKLAGFSREEAPVAWVWQNPQRIALPVGDYLADAGAPSGECRPGSAPPPALGCACSAAHRAAPRAPGLAGVLGVLVLTFMRRRRVPGGTGTLDARQS